MKFFKNKESFIIFTILTLTFLIKLIYLFSHKTHIYLVNEDEIVYIENSLRMIFNNMKPELFFHGALYFDLMAFIYFSIFAIGKIFGFFRSYVDFLMFFLEEPKIFYFISRLFSVFVSTATIYFIYRLGAYLWNKKTGLLAALFFSFIPMTLMQSIKASVYPLENLLIVVSTLWGLKYFREKEPRNLFIMSIVFGLAVAADYYALMYEAINRSLDIYLNALEGRESENDLKKKKVLKIGELSAVVEETVSTIRHWTKAGLLNVAEYTPGGYQLYDLDQVAVVKKIRQLQAKNRLTIAEIKNALNR